MAAAPPPDPTVLIEDLVEEFLLRIPPDDPASLARAALVSRHWHRVITGPVFRRRFREFHRSPPLQGYISNIHNSIQFVPISSFRPRHADLDDVIAIHSSPGRVLLCRRPGKGLDVFPGKGLDVFLSVWDPITDELRDLPALPLPVVPGPCTCNWDAAVICAVGEGCNHIHCGFKVVCVGTSQRRDFSCVYSPEAGSCWSDLIFAASGEHTNSFETGTCVHAGSSLYFLSRFNHEIVKYDLLTDRMSTICFRVEPDAQINGMATVLIATEDGRLGVAKTSNSTLGCSTLHLWIRDHERWEERRPIELRMLLPDDALRDPQFPPEFFPDKPWLAGFAGTGAGVIFFKTRLGYFAVDLNSGRSKNIGGCLGWGCIIPYVSFCTPGTLLSLCILLICTCTISSSSAV